MNGAEPRRRSLQRALLFVGTASALANGCLHEINDQASRGSRGGAMGGGELITQIVPSTNPIALDVMDDSSTTTDACEKTRRDKTEILTAYCASCHSGTAAVGLPPWNFVLDEKRLVSEVWTREGQPAQRFVIPGDPDHSALYQRMGIAGDMPPQPTDLGTHRNPTPSAADISIIREWILHCLGAPEPGGGGTGSGGATPGSGGSGAPGSGGVSPGPGDAGSSGGAGAKGDIGSVPGTGGAPAGSGGAGSPSATGGMSGAAGEPADGGASDGRATGSGGAPAPDGGADDGKGGAAGSSGADGGAETDGGSQGACEAGVSAGHSCVAHTPSCTLGSKTCTCVLSNSKHTWSCR